MQTDAAFGRTVAASTDGRAAAPASATLHPYPAHRESDVALRDGSTVHIRPVRPEDEPALLQFFQGLSNEARAFRFFSGGVNLAAMAHRQSRVDYIHDLGLIATTGPEARIVGHALYATIEGDHAEVAFAIANDYQGRGIATILLGQLAEAAALNGITTFEAEVLPQNHRMLEVFRQSGFPLEVAADFSQIHVAFPASLTPAAIERFESREQTAAVNALTHFFAPKSVAVIGASRHRGTVSGEVFRNLLTYSFNGPVYPVNPTASVVQSVVAYPSVEAIPGEVELAVIVVPASRVLEVAEQCGRKGVKALVIISAGFGEVGDEGRALQAELVRICRLSGMRLIGPNCMGIFSTAPDIRLNGTFAPQQPTAGRVAFASQSGALGISVIDYAASLGLGLSSFVSMGNKADISGNDLINYWAADPRTEVLLLYLESFGNPRKFSRICRRVGRQKPIVVVKSGRSAAGARATSSHTGALLAASDVSVDALFRQAGVVRTDTLAELFDVAAVLANAPVPAGRRLGIVTNAGGPGILCADAAEARGLTIPDLTEATRAALRELLPSEASVTNPVDMIASASAEQYRQVLGLVANDPNVDSVIGIFIPPLVTKPEDVARAMTRARAEMPADVPLLAVFMQSSGAPAELTGAATRIPNFAFPESAAIALAHAARYGEWRSRPLAEPPELPDLRRDEATAIVAGALGRGGGWLNPDEVSDLLGCYGIPLAAQKTVATVEAAGQAAETIGGPVALKAVAPGLVHKSEAGAVKLNLIGAGEVRAAAQAMADRLSELGTPPAGFLVQAMAPKGVEMIVGIVQDRQFGPIVACGAGGTLVEVLKDVSVRLTPLTTDDAAEMIRDLNSYRLLQGFRGAPPADVAALENVLLRVGALADDLPQIAELDCNPVVVLEHGAQVVDARIRVTAVDPPKPLGARR